MLFRAMVDNDFTELVQVLEFAPVFLEMACDQVINGRIWNEHYADLHAVSAFLTMAEPRMDEKLAEGVRRRLQPVRKFSYDEAKAYLERLSAQARNLHSFVKTHYLNAYSTWLEATQLHPLQRIALQKQIETLKE
jgi:hypothetical protein